MIQLKEIKLWRARCEEGGGLGRTLSKSRFKLAVECPTNLFYSLDQRYINSKDGDEFLQALADGGFQVAALAKLMYQAEDPGAIEIVARGEQAQVRETAELLKRENVIVFEGTMRHGHLLVRVDIHKKRGRVVELIEVKSKSFNPLKPDHSFRGARGGIRSVPVLTPRHGAERARGASVPVSCR